jgi:CheW-like domain
MYVAFAVGWRRFVLPAEAAAAVGELGVVLPLPSSDPRRLGVIVHRGRAVALVAAGEGDGEAGATARHYVLLRGDGEDVAFPVDALIGLKAEYGDGLPDGFELFDRRRVVGEPAPVAVEVAPSA